MFVAKKLQQADYQAFIVGGAIRDLLLGIIPKDFDIVTNATPEQILPLFKRSRLIGRRFQIVHVQFKHELIEISTFRSSFTKLMKLNKLDVINNIKNLHSCKRPVTLDNQLLSFVSKNKVNYNSYDFTIRKNSIILDTNGRILIDNFWGKQDEDVLCRDLTINAMYYDPISQIIVDYFNGFKDIKCGILRIIGKPSSRYREDPIRMLRVIRFKAKLDFTIDPETTKPLRKLCNLLVSIPAARLFDEILKILLSGHALESIKYLCFVGLDKVLLPTLSSTLKDPSSKQLIMLTLTRTDKRIASGLQVSPSFILAALLWKPVKNAWHTILTTNNNKISNLVALHLAIDQVLENQLKILVIHRRFTIEMREIWDLQQQLEKKPGFLVLKILENKKFRAAYNFLLLRTEVGEVNATISQWWTTILEGDILTCIQIMADTLDISLEDAHKKLLNQNSLLKQRLLHLKRR